MGAGQRLSAAGLDAVTIDANGTLIELVDPRPALTAALSERGVERSPDEIGAAFAGEVAYYVPRSHEGRDETALAELRRASASVFLGELGAELDAAEFAPALVSALEFTVVAGAREALELLAGRGLALGVVANWDCSLGHELERLRLRRCFGAVVTSAEAGVAKPDPAVFSLALERLGVSAGRTLHIGDDGVDRDGAAAGGLHYLPAPLAAAVRTLDD